MDMEFEELSKKIDKYFSELSDDQLKIDLEKAGYEFYKHMNIQIFSDCVSTESFTISLDSLENQSAQGDMDLVYEAIFVPDNYPFNFSIAA